MEFISFEDAFKVIDHYYHGDTHGTVGVWNENRWIWPNFIEGRYEAITTEGETKIQLLYSMLRQIETVEGIHEERQRIEQEQINAYNNQNTVTWNENWSADPARDIAAALRLENNINNGIYTVTNGHWSSTDEEGRLMEISKQKRQENEEIWIF